MHSLKDMHLSQPFQTHSLCTGKSTERIFFFRLSINKTAVSSEMSADCMAVLARVISVSMSFQITRQVINSVFH